MLRAAALTLMAFTLAMSAPASAQVYGPQGNDTGGIIPWSPAAQAAARAIAGANCGQYGKYAVFTSMRRRYGEYIVYECRFPRYDRNQTVVIVRG